MFAIGAFVLLSTGGAAAFFFKGWLKIPGLESQIRQLESEVNRLNFEIGRLSSEVDRLKGENDRYQGLNNQLNQSLVNFEGLNDDLNGTALQYKRIAEQLNSTNQQLNDKIKYLGEQNNEFLQQNTKLNATVTSLAVQVINFRTSLEKMTLENEHLTNLTESLQALTRHLDNVTATQNETLAELRTTVTNLTGQNSRMEQVNKDLIAVTAFLNETSIGLGNSLQDIASFLAEQIAANQILVLQSLENTYRQRIGSWNCDYSNVFGEDAFAANFSAPITNRSAVLSYVQDRVLSELCLSPADFETFLNSTYPDYLTSSRLIRGVTIYTTDALTYYFPETGETGLTFEDWSNASFTCEKLSHPFLLRE